MIDTIRFTIEDITPRQIRHFSKFKKIGNGLYTYDYQNNIGLFLLQNILHPPDILNPFGSFGCMWRGSHRSMSLI